MPLSWPGRLPACLMLAGLCWMQAAFAQPAPATTAPTDQPQAPAAQATGPTPPPAGAQADQPSSPPTPRADASTATPPTPSSESQPSVSSDAAAPASGALPAKPLPLPPTINQVQVSGVLGRAVIGPDKQQLGHIVNVLVDMSGQPRAAVIDFGGFMGLGSRKIAVDWSAFTFPPSSDAEARLSLTPDEIKNTPEYAGSGQPVKVVSPSTPAPSPGP